MGVRSGVFYFLFLLTLLQMIKLGITRGFWQSDSTGFVQLDSVNQMRLDSLKFLVNREEKKYFLIADPNRLEDYKGYQLGIPHPVLDKIYRFRRQGGVFETIDQFKEISGLSDSSISRLTPYFRFPVHSPGTQRKMKPPTRSKKGLNLASANELRQVRGIGPVLSRRIVRFREALGGFLHESQLYDVYGLEPEVARRVGKAFPIMNKPEIQKLNLNKATAEELASLLYLTHSMALEIVERRSLLGPYQSLQELRHIESVPNDKIERIALYLGL